MSNTDNLEKLLQALRERAASETAELFSMGTYAHTCGTPACSLGTYAAWDGQTFLDPPTESCRYPVIRETSEPVRIFERAEVLQHFGISRLQANMLFDSSPVDGFDTELGLGIMCDGDCLVEGCHCRDCDRAWSIQDAIKATEAVIEMVRGTVTPSRVGDA